MEKPATTNFPITQLIEKRWSPRAFADRLLTRAEVGALFEAARWAPSAYNEQPWRFLFATRDDPSAFAQALGGLIPWNQAWAGHAALLVLCFQARRFERNGKENALAAHDVGLATENLLLQAQSLGLRAHVMSGIDPVAIRERYAVPDGFDPITAIAVGALGTAEDLPEDMQEGELAPRSRRALTEIVFKTAWGVPASLVD
jgi:nitroreductase